jgi:hypothetical protein
VACHTGSCRICGTCKNEKIQFVNFGGASFIGRNSLAYAVARRRAHSKRDLASSSSVWRYYAIMKSAPALGAKANASFEGTKSRMK